MKPEQLLVEWLALNMVFCLGSAILVYTWPERFMRRMEPETRSEKVAQIVRDAIVWTVGFPVMLFGRLIDGAIDRHPEVKLVEVEDR